MNVTIRRFLPALGLILVLAAGLPALADFQESHEFKADRLVVSNLIGAIEITGGAARFEVEVHVQGDDASPDEVQIFADDGGRASLSVRFPNDRKFVYPALGRRSKTTFSPDSDGERGWLSEVLGQLTGSGRVTVSGSGSGTEIWADLQIRVPDGGELEMKLGVGNIVARSVNGELVLDSHSGSVEVDRVVGDLVVDTGSGHVQLGDIDGEISVDTGSGHVEGSRLRGGNVSIDTGSGHVELDDVDAPNLVVDTGSGGVRVVGLRTDGAEIDTGSGSVTMLFERMGDGDYVIDTGSGGVTLELPHDASVDVRADTGSGGVDLALDNVDIRHRERDEVAFEMNGGRSKVRIDTGSGGVRIRHSD